jgi:hypothetical protein
MSFKHNTCLLRTQLQIHVSARIKQSSRSERWWKEKMCKYTRNIIKNEHFNLKNYYIYTL